ncbi:hypothetical protein DW651_13590 [Subdoligranulum sp. AM23-21AC]|uniref:Uncharacterized protein n=1 Tax=Ruthenibacterium lactatiformans TaxID=1550024 RepID=A0A0D8IZI7_9FIRM|nr:hypothetical protein TQ39_08095 [Ruthenibacterium lactatiformans]RGD19408.1 hypothetical protein DW651_13590 [Subdoligranulum sp. AM23-21AC]RJW28539.1 hypothetical protein DXC43_12505 [Subdoligranulum sp. TF05-17AC]
MRAFFARKCAVFSASFAIKKHCRQLFARLQFLRAGCKIEDMGLHGLYNHRPRPEGRKAWPKKACGCFK